MPRQSPRQDFLNRSSSSDQDYFDNLIRIERTAYQPHQVGQRFHGSLARTKINRGGLGSGKTRMMSEHIYALALQYPGSTHVIGRKDLPQLKETTQKEFLQEVVSPETVRTFNVNENKLILLNNSDVLFRQTKDPADFKSMQITSYGIDEADENESSELWEMLDDRLRQKIRMPSGEIVIPPYCGIFTFNPTHEEHWLYELATRKDISLEDFQSSTYDNAANLPPDYIPNLLKKLPPWEISRLVLGNWGRNIKGKPVYHGFTYDVNVRPLRVNESWPLLRGWDFGFNHPAVRWMQIDPMTGRCFLLREFLGKQQYLNAEADGKPSVIDEVERITGELVGDSYPIFDYCDPHGADRKDNAISSVEMLQRDYGINCIYRREKIETGMEEIQNRILSKAFWSPSETDRMESLWLVDPSCKVTIAAYMGGYHRDEEGRPRKDGYYDHLMDVDRYILVHNMNLHLVHRRGISKNRYRPRNPVTGY